MNDQKQVPVPTAIKELILTSNELLENYQKELTNKVIVANAEVMQMLGLKPEDGWKLDIGTMQYVKEEIKHDDTSIS